MPASAANRRVKSPQFGLAGDGILRTPYCAVVEVGEREDGGDDDQFDEEDATIGGREETGGAGQLHEAAEKTGQGQQEYGYLCAQGVALQQRDHLNGVRFCLPPVLLQQQECQEDEASGPDSGGDKMGEVSGDGPGAAGGGSSVAAGSKGEECGGGQQGGPGTLGEGPVPRCFAAEK